VIIVEVENSFLLASGSVCDLLSSLVVVRLWIIHGVFFLLLDLLALGRLFKDPPFQLGLLLLKGQLGGLTASMVLVVATLCALVNHRLIVLIPLVPIVVLDQIVVHH